MINSKRFLGIVPARGGSSRLENKNIRYLSGQPLISYVLQRAQAVQEIDRLIVSTDDKEIARISMEWGAEVPFMRSDELAHADTPLMPVIMDVLEKLEGEGDHYDYVSILQPNSPLTLSEDILRAMRTCIKSKTNIVFSVCECAHPPQWTLRLSEDDYPQFSFIEDSGQTFGRTQDQELQYRSTGAIYVAEVSYLKANPIKARLALPCIGQKSTVIVTDPVHSVDIDTELELLFAEVLMNLQKNKH
jgi:CMP-N,N'-diacetyllegionaminic acid synthase